MVVSEKKKYCPHCGDEIIEESKFCTTCGASLDPGEDGPSAAGEKGPSVAGGEKRSYVEHLTVGFNVAASQPMVFVPAVLAGVIGAVIYWVTMGSMGYTAALLSIVASIITFVLNFASIDMSRDAYQNEALDLGESVNYVTGRIVEFIVAAIVGGLMSVTIILIPVVILMFVVMVMDETGITDAVSKSLDVLRADLGDVLLILLVSIVGSFVISYVPFVSTLLDAALNVVVGLAFIDLYANYKSD
jgi:predicted RNA-binding Zn-ribbon protein involved in translation (DUF1610 family)